MANAEELLGGGQFGELNLEGIEDFEKFRGEIVFRGRTTGNNGLDYAITQADSIDAIEINLALTLETINGALKDAGPGFFIPYRLVSFDSDSSHLSLSCGFHDGAGIRYRDGRGIIGNPRLSTNSKHVTGTIMGATKEGWQGREVVLDRCPMLKDTDQDLLTIDGLPWYEEREIHGAISYASGYCLGVGAMVELIEEQPWVAEAKFEALCVLAFMATSQGWNEPLRLHASYQEKLEKLKLFIDVAEWHLQQLMQQRDAELSDLNAGRLELAMPRHKAVRKAEVEIVRGIKEQSTSLGFHIMHFTRLPELSGDEHKGTGMVTDLESYSRQMADLSRVWQNISCLKRSLVF